MALILFLVFYVGPFVWTFIISITPDSLVLGKSLSFLPEETTLKNYKTLFDVASPCLTFLTRKTSPNLSWLPWTFSIKKHKLSLSKLASTMIKKPQRR